MAAIYPTSIRNFFYKQDFTQIVDASDVNVGYDEINAVQKTLGILPQTDMVDGSVVTWADVKTNIAAARSKVVDPIMQVGANDNQIPYNTTQPIVFQNKGVDTHGIWQGGGTFMCPRSGWYDFAAYLTWHSSSNVFDNQQPVFNHTGQLQAGIMSTTDTSHFWTAQSLPVSQGMQMALRSSFAISALWLKGQAIQILATQSALSGQNQFVGGIFSISYRRVPPTINNM